MKIYTRTGDAGDTGLLGGMRVSKGDLRVEAYGEVDELNASLGTTAANVSNTEIGSVLEQIQRDLFSVGALLANPTRAGKKNDKISLDPEDVHRLEETIDRFDATYKTRQAKGQGTKEIVTDAGGSACAGVHR